MATVLLLIAVVVLLLLLDGPTRATAAAACIDSVLNSSCRRCRCGRIIISTFLLCYPCLVVTDGPGIDVCSWLIAAMA